jgi:gallate dioxygenase
LQLTPQRAANQTKIDYYARQYDGADVRLDKFNCVKPVIPEVSTTAADIKKTTTSIDAWQNCYKGFVNNLTTLLPVGKAIPADLQSLMTDEFDIGTFRGRGLDHGCFSPLSVLLPHEQGEWPVQIVPLQVGVLQFPIPTARRCFKLGQALRTAIESYSEDLKVALVATGGLSHQVHGERCGFNNPEWDARFMDLLESDPEALCRMTHARYAELGGMEGAEVIMWLIMRGALSAKVRCLHRSYYLPSMTGIATAVYENESPLPDEAFLTAHRTRMGEQLAGAERLQGTYPYTLERSAKAYRLNRFLHSLVEPAARAAFLADEAKAMGVAKLSEEEQNLVHQRDWRRLIHYGAIFFVLEKLAAVTGVSNLHIYASMRGETLEDFMKTRNQQVTYSVAAQPA